MFRNLTRIKALKCLTLAIFAMMFVLGSYVLSIVWRVSVAQNDCFGRSELIPLRFPPIKFTEQAVASSYGHKTYSYVSPAGKIIVWRQKINGFQHMYGSALASYELGEELSDLLFRLNEFAEFTFDFNSVEPSDLLDRKKDLVNNSIGREIGSKARVAKLFGHAAESFIILECLKAVETDPRFLPHYLDPRVAALKEDALGCPFLPERNFFNIFRKTPEFK